jgi:hypothetical protein
MSFLFDDSNNYGSQNVWIELWYHKKGMYGTEKSYEQQGN